MNEIKYFGKYGEQIQHKQLDLEFPVSFKELKLKIISKDKFLENEKWAVAINKKIILDDDFQINESDEIAVMPPFSGG